ncbi:hypothetical protein J5893_00355 [bacterium]|nr:hypothetical protein [bacterium]
MKMSNELYKFPDPNRQDETGSSIMQKLKSAGFKDMNQFNDIKRDKKD